MRGPGSGSEEPDPDRSSSQPTREPSLLPPSSAARASADWHRNARLRRQWGRRQTEGYRSRWPSLHLSAASTEHWKHWECLQQDSSQSSLWIDCKVISTITLFSILCFVKGCLQGLCWCLNRHNSFSFERVVSASVWKSVTTKQLNSEYNSSMRQNSATRFLFSFPQLMYL